MSALKCGMIVSRRTASWHRPAGQPTETRPGIRTGAAGRRSSIIRTGRRGAAPDEPPSGRRQKSGR